MASSATPRSPKVAPNALMVGTPMMPFWPPVRSRHSAAPFSTTKPKAMVTIARYGPFTRSAGSASSAPTSAESATAGGSASQKSDLRRGGEDRHRVGADGVEADVAEGHLAGEAEQDVQADAGDGGERQRRHDEDVVAVGVAGEMQAQPKKSATYRRGERYLIPSSPRRGRTGRSASAPAPRSPARR